MANTPRSGRVRNSAFWIKNQRKHAVSVEEKIFCLKTSEFFHEKTYQFHQKDIFKKTSRILNSRERFFCLFVKKNIVFFLKNKKTKTNCQLWRCRWRTRKPKPGTNKPPRQGTPEGPTRRGERVAGRRAALASVRATGVPMYMDVLVEGLDFAG